MVKKEIAIKVDNLTKSFKIPLEASNGIKQKLINNLKGHKGYREFTPLKDISFEIEKGDFFGIVGRNGSGKSTLLKTIAGIYTPNKGLVHVSGTLVPFIELGVGFNPELTGRENVFLNGALLGFSRTEMEAMYDGIVEFAELEEFMDERLKNYSSGMQVRLAFSIAIRAEGDILLLDEVLAVGDEAFQRKCNDYFEELRDTGRTVVLITHSMENIKKYCNKAMMIRDGEIVIFGSPEDVANEYSIENLTTQQANSEKKTRSDQSEDEIIDDNEKDNPIKSLKINLLSNKKISQNEEIIVQYTIQTSEDIKLRIDMDVQHIDKKTYIFSSSSEMLLYRKNQQMQHTVKFKASALNDMIARVNSSIKDEKGNLLAFVWNDDAPSFMIRRDDYPMGLRKDFAILFDRGDWVD